jgi:hypothetical protein
MAGMDISMKKVLTILSLLCMLQSAGADEVTTTTVSEQQLTEADSGSTGTGTLTGEVKKTIKGWDYNLLWNGSVVSGLVKNGTGEFPFSLKTGETGLEGVFIREVTGVRILYVIKDSFTFNGTLGGKPFSGSITKKKKDFSKVYRTDTLDFTVGDEPLTGTVRFKNRQELFDLQTSRGPVSGVKTSRGFGGPLYEFDFPGGSIGGRIKTLGNTKTVTMQTTVTHPDDVLLFLWLVAYQWIDETVNKDD